MSRALPYTTPLSAEEFVRAFTEGLGQIARNAERMGTVLAALYIEARNPTEFYSPKFLRLARGIDEIPKNKKL